MKVVRLSAIPRGNIPGTHFCWRLSQPQGYSATETIMSMKNSIDTIGNRTRDLPACSAVPQPTAPTRAPCGSVSVFIKKNVDFHPLLNFVAMSSKQFSAAVCSKIHWTVA